uniref:DUF4817 domain-containing protein n=1 Tax=Strigamia maritima TaxID=126957 RepID=T1IRE6_STRMM
MANYTTQELVDIVYCYAECGRIAARMYAQRFSTRRHPNAPTVCRFILRFEATGNIQSQHGRRRQQPDGDADRAVTVCDIMADPHKFHPYHLHCHQGLLPHDHQLLDFCNWLLIIADDDLTFLDRIM